MATASAERPTVFISANDNDAEWGEGLKRALENDGRTEWWDGSRIRPGRQRSHEIEEAFTRASLAVLLLSPEYLASANVAVLIGAAASRALAIFPIVVHDCQWQSVEGLRDWQVWAMGRPLDKLVDSALHRELQAIANYIAQTALEHATAPRPIPAPPGPGSERNSDSAPVPPGSPNDRTAKAAAPPSNASSTSEFQFSHSADGVLARARNLATQSGRARVTSSCLLFALTESAGGERKANDTPWFIRQAIERTGKYGEALNAFMTDATKGRQGSATLEPLGAVSANVRATLEAARSMAERTSRARTIHSRHLLAALLVAPAQSHEPAARMRLQRVGVDMAVLVRDFLLFLRAYAPTDNDAAWAAILGAAGAPMPESPPEPPRSWASASAPADNRYVSGPAGYTSEFVGVGGTHPISDELGVKGSAHRLAELIALRETKMPLAIGLFGDWGSGKSHFMNLIDRRLKTLAETAVADGPWCKEIIPIYFNAWHYLDANPGRASSPRSSMACSATSSRRRTCSRQRAYSCATPAAPSRSLRKK